MKALLLVFVLSHGALAWDNLELDLFDLVEEVQATHKKTFYEFLDLAATCSTSDVRRAYKKLALVLHPDKSDATDADIQFRQLAAVYEVLKDKDLRDRYDRVLVEGLPNWKSTAFYFRRMRKIGLAEGLLYLLVIVTGIQYCVNWAAYLERKFTISENVASEVRRKQKKLKKTGKSEEEMAQEMVDIQMVHVGLAPTAFDTLPFQMVRAVKSLLLALPTIPGQLREAYAEQKRIKELKAKEQQEWEDEKRAREEEKMKKKEAKAKRKTVSQFKELMKEERDERMMEEREVKDYVTPPNAGQMWTDPDLVELARLIKKIPGGSNDRWDRIAEAMGRTPGEVTKMAGKIKNNPSIVPKMQGVTGREEDRMIGDECLEVEGERTEDSHTDEDEVDEDGYVVYNAVKAEEYIAPQEKKKKKTKGGKLGEVIEEGGTECEVQWSQEQQRNLEVALALFPKGSIERWEKIAGKVEGRTKEQCIARFKLLAEQVKRKKAEKAE